MLSLQLTVKVKFVDAVMEEFDLSVPLRVKAYVPFAALDDTLGQDCCLSRTKPIWQAVLRQSLLCEQGCKKNWQRDRGPFAIALAALLQENATWEPP